MLHTGSYSDSCTSCTIDASCTLRCECDGPKGPVESACNLKCCNFLANNLGLLFCDSRQCPMSC